MELQPEHISKLTKKAFEQFLYRLLASELDDADRFAPGTVTLDGPGEDDHADGMRDCRVVLGESCRGRANFALLPDDKGETWYTCKARGSSTTKSPLSAARDELCPGRVFKDDGTLKADAETIAAKSTSKPRAHLLEFLARGGRVVIAVNVRVTKREDVTEQLRRELNWWAKRVLGVTLDLSNAFRVVDANDLAQAYRKWPFSLSGELLAELGLEEPDFLLTWEAWTQRFQQQRDLLPFELDNARVARLEALTQVIDLVGDADPEARTVRIAGSPGTGKTRLVHQLFAERTALSRRVRYSDDASTTLRWLQANMLAPDAILVVDEVASDLAPTLLRTFAGQPRGTRLILVSPRTDDEHSAPTPLLLEPLADHALEQLIERAVGTMVEPAMRGEIVEIVANLSEGYPLFALWLAKGLAQYPAALAEPRGRLTNGEDPWIATRLVLAGEGPKLVGGSQDSPDERTALARAVALLFVIAEPRIPWSDLDDTARDAFAAACDFTTAELDEASRKCEARGLLRRFGGNRQYVSPANLERLILNHLFGGSTPPRRPRKLREGLSPVQFGNVLSRAAQVRATPDCQRNLADAVLQALDDGQPIGQNELFRASHAAPEHAVVVLRRRLAQAREGSRVFEHPAWILHALEGIRHRRLPDGLFTELEAVLFELGMSGDNFPAGGALATWASLFRPWMHLTHAPYELRLRLLDRRLTERDATRRLAALDGLSEALALDSSGSYAVGIDDIDGEWEHATYAEIVTRAGDGWDRVFQRSRDEDAGVSGRARRLAADHLRSTLGRGLGVDHLRHFAALVASWTAFEKAKVAAACEDVRRFDLQSLEEHPELVAALNAVASAAQPTDLREQIVAHVGEWFPGPAALDAQGRELEEARVDAALARDVVDNPGIAPAIFDWIASGEAARNYEFGRALGEQDPARSLFPLLLHHSAGGDSTMVRFAASYLVGWSHAVGEDQLNSWLSDAEKSGGNDWLVTRTIASLRADSTRALLLGRLVEAGRTQWRWLSGIGAWNWSGSLATAEVQALTELLIRSRDVEVRIEGIGLAAKLIERGEQPLEPRLWPELNAALRETGTSGNPGAGVRWAKVLTWLGLRHDNEALRVAFEVALATRGYSHDVESVLRAWLDAGESSALWDALSSALKAGYVPAIRLRPLLHATDALRRLPVDRVLEWIGGDEARGVVMATLCSPHARLLDPIARELVVRFGGESRPARELSARAGSTVSVVTSLVRFHEQQAANARAWATDANPEVCAWARRVADRELAAAQRELAEQELFRRHG